LHAPHPVTLPPCLPPNPFGLSSLHREEPEAGEGAAKNEATRKAKKLFNEESSKKGMKALIECGAVEETPEDVAKYLHETPGLNKKHIGEYLGEHTDFHKGVVLAYLKLQDFTGLDFDKALRSYLWGFRLPGESQKIDRLMEQVSVVVPYDGWKGRWGLGGAVGGSAEDGGLLGDDC